MAALDVAGVTSRWLRQVANDGEMLDRTEMMCSDMYHPEEEEASWRGVEEARPGGH